MANSTGVRVKEEMASKGTRQPTVFPCDICSATFVTQISLTRHMILHEDDVKLEEPVAAAAKVKREIPQANLLETILKNGSKAVLPRKSNHVASASSRPIPNLKPLPLLIPFDDSQAKNFQCSLCSVYFSKKEDLARHQTRTHGGSRFTCPYCSRNISRRDHLKRHIKNVHPEYCTANEIGPFLADPNASRTAKELHAENFAVQYAVSPEEPSTKKRKLSSTAGSGNDNDVSESSFVDDLLFQNDQNQDFQEMDDGLQLQEGYTYEGEEEDYENGDEMPDDENITVEPDFSATDDGIRISDGIYEEQEQNEYSETDNYGEQENNNGDVGSMGSIVPSPLPILPERKFKCESCDAAFMSRINMLRHMSTHSIVRPHKCSVCGKGFLRKEHLSKHLSSVHSGLKYKCQFCSKDISRKDHLLRHIRNCHPVEFSGIGPDMIDSEPQVASIDERSINKNPKVAALACDMCTSQFHHIDELHEHQSAAHSDIRKFKCPSCPKAFKRKEHLFKHQATHAAESQKAFSCSKCGLVFPLIEDVYVHIRQAHESAPQKPKESFPCNLCESLFGQRKDMVQHLKSYHGVSNPENRILHNSNSGSNLNNSRARTAINSQITNVTNQAQPQIRRANVANSKPKARTAYRQTASGQGQGQSSTGSSVQAKLQSLLGITVPVKNKMDEGSLGSLMGLINKGSLSLSLT